VTWSKVRVAGGRQGRLSSSGVSLTALKCSQRNLYLCVVFSFVSPIRSPGHSSRLDAPVVTGDDVGL
jgi:hypothetical protein